MRQTLVFAFRLPQRLTTIELAAVQFRWMHANHGFGQARSVGESGENAQRGCGTDGSIAGGGVVAWFAGGGGGFLGASRWVGYVFDVTVTGCVRLERLPFRDAFFVPAGGLFFEAGSRPGGRPTFLCLGVCQGSCRFSRQATRLLISCCARSGLRYTASGRCQLRGPALQRCGLRFLACAYSCMRCCSNRRSCLL